MSHFYITVLHCVSLPVSWEALSVSQHTELIVSPDVELHVVTSGSRPTAALSPEPLGGVGGVGGVGVVALLAPAELLGLDGVAEPGPGEDAGHAAGEGDLAGAAPHVDAVGSRTDSGVPVPRQLETLALTVQCLSPYNDLLPDILVPDGLQGLV